MADGVLPTVIDLTANTATKVSNFKLVHGRQVYNSMFSLAK
jgi:hypothetical protein